MKLAFRRIAVPLLALLCALALVQVVFAAPPAADFTVSPAIPEVSTSVTFESTVTDPAYSYAWDFGDGTTGAGASSSHTYASNGSWDVTLTITDPTDGLTSSVVRSVRVNAPPVASFSCNPATVGQNQPSSCTSASSDEESTPSLAWDGDNDGSFDDGSDSNEVFFYPTAGVKTVRLRVTDSDGVSRIAERQITVTSTQPTARFEITPNPALVGEVVTFDGSDSSDQTGGSITNYEWDLDGDASTGPQGFEVNRGLETTASSSYASPGLRTIRLRVTDNDGARDVRNRQLRVQETRPNAAFSFAPQAPGPGQAITFTSGATSSSPSREITAIEWDFNYDPTQDFTREAVGANARTSFATPGAKPVAIRVTESGGGMATAFATVVVNAPPQASFNVAPAAPFEGDSITLSSTSSDPDGPLAGQQWDLDGDGQYDDAGGAVVARAYRTGPHIVRLRVTDARGAVSTAARNINVLKRPPKFLTGVKVTLFGDLTRNGVKLKRLLVRAPGKATVKITCKGRKCPKGARAASKRPVRTARLRFKKFERSFPAGTLITVTVTRPGYIGQHTSIKVRKDLRRYIRKDRCLPPGSGKPVACPADS